MLSLKEGRSRETFAVAHKLDGHLAQRFITIFLIYGPSDHPRFAFLALILYLLVRSLFISTHRDEVIESATSLALIKNGKKHIIKLMSSDILATFIS